MVASLNSMQRKQERFIEIVADGKIEEDEIKDFVNIQEQLEKISLTVKSLQLWSEQMLVNNVIDREEYEKYRNK